MAIKGEKEGMEGKGEREWIKGKGAKEGMKGKGERGGGGWKGKEDLIDGRWGDGDEKGRGNVVLGEEKKKDRRFEWGKCKNEGGKRQRQIQRRM